MLVNRTIDKPKEKLELLLNFLRKNDLLDNLISFKKKDSIVFINQYYIEEKKMCEILKIEQKTLRNWDKKSKGYLTLSYGSYRRKLEMIRFELLNKFNNDEEIFKKKYYDIYSLLQFLCFENSSSRLNKEFKKRNVFL